MKSNNLITDTKIYYVNCWVNIQLQNIFTKYTYIQNIISANDIAVNNKGYLLNWCQVQNFDMNQQIAGFEIILFPIMVFNILKRNKYQANDIYKMRVEY